MPPRVRGGEFDGLVVDEDGFVFGREWVDAVARALFRSPLRERGILPDFGGLIPLPGFPFRWRTLIGVIRERGWLTSVNGLWPGVGFRRLPVNFVPFAIVDDDARDFIAQLGVGFEPLPPRLFPRFEFVGNAIAVVVEGQFGRIRIGLWGLWRRGACTLAVGGVGQPTEGAKQVGCLIAIFEEACDAHQASAVWANERIGLPDFLNEFAPFLARDAGKGVARQFDDFDVGVCGLGFSLWSEGIGAWLRGKATIIGVSALFVVLGFALAGKVSVGAPSGQGSLCGTAEGVFASGLAALATGAIAVGTIVADEVLLIRACAGLHRDCHFAMDPTSGPALSPRRKVGRAMPHQKSRRSEA